MNIFRTILIALIAALVPGGSIVLIPPIQRWVNRARERSRERAAATLTPKGSGSKA